MYEQITTFLTNCFIWYHIGLNKQIRTRKETKEEDSKPIAPFLTCSYALALRPTSYVLPTYPPTHLPTYALRSTPHPIDSTTMTNAPKDLAGLAALMRAETTALKFYTDREDDDAVAALKFHEQGLWDRFDEMVVITEDKMGSAIVRAKERLMEATGLMAKKFGVIDPVDSPDPDPVLVTRLYEFLTHGVDGKTTDIVVVVLAPTPDGSLQDTVRAVLSARQSIKVHLVIYTGRYNVKGNSGIAYKALMADDKYTDRVFMYCFDQYSLFGANTPAVMRHSADAARSAGKDLNASPIGRAMLSFRAAFAGEVFDPFTKSCIKNAKRQQVKSVRVVCGDEERVDFFVDDIAQVPFTDLGPLRASGDLWEGDLVTEGVTERDLHDAIQEFKSVAHSCHASWTDAFDFETASLETQFEFERKVREAEGIFARHPVLANVRAKPKKMASFDRSAGRTPASSGITSDVTVPIALFTEGLWSEWDLQPWVGEYGDKNVFRLTVKPGASPEHVGRIFASAYASVL